MNKRYRSGAAWKSIVLSRDEQFDLKRAALLREAARAFSARGYHQTTLDDIAAVLGVTKAALYYYVKSKQQILFECHMLSLDLGNSAIEYACAHGKNGYEKTSLLTRRNIELITGEMGTFAVLAEFNALTPENRETIRKRRHDFEEVLKGFITEGIADGSIRDVDPKLACFFYMGAVNWMTRWFSPEGAVKGEDIAMQFSDLFGAAVRRQQE